MRRSKASAGEAPNLPPHRGLSSLSSTMVQFNLPEQEKRESGTIPGIARRHWTYGPDLGRTVFWYCLMAALMVERPSVACLVRLPIMSLPIESMSSP